MAKLELISHFLLDSWVCVVVLCVVVFFVKFPLYPKQCCHSLLFFYQDVITIEKTGENFRLLYDVKGRFATHRIHSDEAKVGSFPENFP